MIKAKVWSARLPTTNECVLIPNVSKSPDWLPNPLLPDTKAEIAVPIAIGNHVLGVLDVQEDKVNGLTTVDSDLLESIANQVAIAVQNADQYEQAEARAVELQETTTFLDSIIDNLPIMLTIKDASDLSYIRINQNGANLLGMNQEATLGKTSFDLYSQEESRIHHHPRPGGITAWETD